MIFDAHLDLAYNQINFGRDIRKPVAETRRLEIKKPQPSGVTTVSLSEMRKGSVHLCFGSLYAMPASMQRLSYESHVTYNDSAPLHIQAEQAHAVAMKQFDLYHQLHDSQQNLHLLRRWQDVETVIARSDTDDPIVGVAVHMEGAAPIKHPDELPMWHARGLRSIGLAWDDSPYAPGQWREAGRLPKAGYQLLERMAELNMLADITHMSEAAAWDLIDAYEGPIAATHGCARGLVDIPRNFSDRQLEALAERGGVMGVALFNIFLRPDHPIRGERALVPVATVIDHIDYVCQLLGSAEFVGIGSDLDGGFGLADTPAGIDSIADLHLIGDGLKQRGYTAAEIDAICYGNWLRLLRRTLE